MAADIRQYVDVPLRWKLVAMMLGVTILSLVLLAAGLMLRERQEFNRRMEDRLGLLADVIGLNSTAAIAFDDTTAAREVLAALASDRQVMAGALYDENDALFAHYLRSDVALALPNPAPPVSGMTFDEKSVSLTRTVRLNGVPIGKIHLVADTAEWRGTLWEFAGIVTALFLVVLAIGLLVSTWLQRIVTEPIVELVGLMRRVGQEHNYQLRACPRTSDELGFLANGFNGMLEELAIGRSELEHARDELRRLNEDLEQRVRDRTAELETANKELEAFSYSVSHDLRAPLRAIDGFSAALMNDYKDKLDDTARNYLLRVRNGCQRMGLLIDDLLGLARVVRHEMRMENVDLAAIARNVAAQLAQAQPQRCVEIKIPESLPVTGDPGLLRIALENLLNNAWKFTQHKPDPKIELSAAVENGETVFCIRDNGAGFEMAYVHKLFRAFQRLHDATAYPGTGIGLATVLRVIQRHGGRIWAEGAVNQGAAFYFTLKERT